MSEEEETYQLTFKGLLYLAIQDEELVRDTIDSLELYLRRHYSKGGHPAIVFDLDSNKFEFVTLSRQDQ